MAKCDVCGKTSLLPEKIGEVNICKICFMKINGFLWKHKYERYDEAEKQRNKALESAHKYDFPPNVLKAINDFFVMQMNAMLNCDCCGQPVQQLERIGNTKICKECFAKINTSAWREIDYDDNEEVEKNRQKILKIATKNNFPPNVLEAINMYFNSKIQQGLICSFDGKEGQKIKVFETYCLLKTDKNFDVEDITERYREVLKRANPQTNIFGDKNVAQTIAKSVFTGGLIQTGAKIAASVAANKVADKMTAPKGTFKVLKGEYLIDYSVYNCVDYQERGENDLGFIRFRCNGGENHNDDVLFFLSVENKKADRTYEEICKGICRVKQNIVTARENISPIKMQTQNNITISVADEILKFKNLLDQGIITQEEFEAKKRELLNL